MEVIKIIDLFNKMANGEEVPKKIKYKSIILEYDENIQDYYKWDDGGLFSRLFTTDYPSSFLNTEVEILDTPKIKGILATSLKGIDDLNEKIEIVHTDTICAINKINELIDKLNNLNE